MASRKRCLLFASPFGGLQGPENDVELMAAVLDEQGFEITRCCGIRATYDGMRSAWQDLNNTCKEGDVVLIYYSGHGGLVDPPRHVAPSSADHTEAHDGPLRYQFIVPMDYAPNGDFKGMLDVEISQLLRDTTEKTKNVTLVLDCCHSGRLAREPAYQSSARPKSLLEVQHHEISEHVARLRAQGRIREETGVEGNMDAVRIAAAAATETAWEYEDAQGQWCGSMTNVLARAIRESQNREISWQTMMLRVRELVNIRFPQQHPQAEGPSTRLPFLLQHIDTRAILIKVEDGTACIKAGRVAGVRVGNIYTIMPFGSERPNTRKKLCYATVTDVNSFNARVDLNFESGEGSIPTDGALAFLQYEALHKWPVAVSHDLEELKLLINESSYLRCVAADDISVPLASLQRRGNEVILVKDTDLTIATAEVTQENTLQQAFLSVIKAAETLARAQHFLALQSGNDEELLDADVAIDLGLVKDGRPGQSIPSDGSGRVTEGDRIYIRLCNQGVKTVYVSVFEVNTMGNITLVSYSWSEGIELKACRSHTLGKDQFFDRYKGLEFSWPEGPIPKTRPTDEYLVFVISSAAADLRVLESPTARRSSTKSSISSLEELVDRISLGNKRDLTRDSSCTPVQYATFRIPFLLHGRLFDVADLRTPEVTPEWADLSREGPPASQASKGLLGAAYRAAHGIPKHVRVVNQHDDDITVVVSKYRPTRRLSGIGINASATGGGLDVSTTQFFSPATRKTLAPAARDPGASIGLFPLWSGREGFGVISIFKGAEQTLFIENDQIPIGSTAYFINAPNLRIVPYDKRRVLDE